MHDGMPYKSGSKVKVTRRLKLDFLQFSKSISSCIFNVSWQMITDSETTEQYLNFVRTRFLISVVSLISVFVSRDYEPQHCTGLIFHFANAFAIAITFARWRRRSEEATAVPYGTGLFFICILFNYYEFINLFVFVVMMMMMMNSVWW